MVQYFPIVTGSLTVTGSVNVSGSITTNSTITATTLVVQTITSSISSITGSTNFGSLSSNTHIFTGSMAISGGLVVSTPTPELTVGTTGVTLGNALTDSHVISGSLRVNPNGLFVTSSGQVGIGTTTPNDLLEVRGGFIRLSATSGNGPQFNLYSNGQTSNHVTLAQGFALATDNIGYLYNRANADFVFGTNNTERMRITSGGSVQITGNDGSIYQKAATAGSAVYWDIRTSADARRAYIGFGGTSSSTFAFNNNENGDMFFATNNTERMRITAAGNVQIDSGQLNTPKSLSFQANSNTGGNLGTIDWYNFQWDGAIRAQIKGETDTGLANGRLVFSTGGGGVTERMRITSAGIVIIGTPSANNSSTNLQVEGTAAIGQMTLRFANAASGRHWRVGPDNANNFVIYNENNTGAYIGYSGTSWTANSDERLKDINKNIENATEDLMTLRAVNFSWKSDESKKENLGLIAQDVEKVFPQLIDINHNGMLGVRYTEMIPVLVKAIQELNTKFEEYKATHP